MTRWDLAPALSYGGTAFLYQTQGGNATTIPGGGGAIVIPGTTGGNNTTFSNTIGFGSLKWEIDLWGRLRRAVESSEGQLFAQEENQRAVILSLVGSVSEAYFSLRSLDLQVDITKRTLKTWEESVRLSQLKLKQGSIPKLDLDRFEAERAGTAAKLAELEKQVVQTENHLSVLLGRTPASIARGLKLTEQPIPPEVPAGLPSELLQRRPDLIHAGLGDGRYRRGASKSLSPVCTGWVIGWSQCESQRQSVGALVHSEHQRESGRPVAERHGAGLPGHGQRNESAAGGAAV
jgi:multidrug efflux system outer membrane protein